MDKDQRRRRSGSPPAVEVDGECPEPQPLLRGFVRRIEAQMFGQQRLDAAPPRFRGIGGSQFSGVRHDPSEFGFNSVTRYHFPLIVPGMGAHGSTARCVAPGSPVASPVGVGAVSYFKVSLAIVEIVILGCSAAADDNSSAPLFPGTFALLIPIPSFARIFTLHTCMRHEEPGDRHRYLVRTVRVLFRASQGTSSGHWSKPIACALWCCRKAAMKTAAATLPAPRFNDMGTRLRERWRITRFVVIRCRGIR